MSCEELQLFQLNVQSLRPKLWSSVKNCLCLSLSLSDRYDISLLGLGFEGLGTRFAAKLFNR